MFYFWLLQGNLRSSLRPSNLFLYKIPLSCSWTCDIAPCIFLGGLLRIVVVRHQTTMRLIWVYNMAWPTRSLPITDVLALCRPLSSIQRCIDSQSKLNLPGHVFGLLSLLLIMYSANAQVLSGTRTEKKSFRLACSYLMLQPFSFMSSSIWVDCEQFNC